MKMKLFSKICCAFFLTVLLTTPVLGVTVSWTDWTSSTANSALGELLVGTTTVGVEYLGTSNHSFVNTGTGTNFWTEGSPPAYTNGTIDNAPTAAEQIALSNGGTVTVNFLETIENPFIAMNSWNNNTVEFGMPIVIDSFGAGFWGSGTATLNSGGTGFFGSGEFHGVVSLLGSFDSISFTHTSENWHGFTVGVAGLASPGPGPSPVPEPTTMLLFATGLVGLAGVSLRRRKK